MPQAERLGLRYVAHVVQTNQHHDLFTRSHMHLLFELQIFENRVNACHWLREVRDVKSAQTA